MRFADVVLVGSVLPRDFWETFEEPQLADQAARICNHRARGDRPVALLCGGLRGLFVRDVGTSGFDGFRGQRVKEVAFYPGGHSDALASQHHADLAAFALGGKLIRSPSLVNTPGVMRQMSNLAPYVAFLLVASSVTAIGWFVIAGPLGLGTRIALAAGPLAALYIALDSA